MSETSTTPAPELLSAGRLAEIKPDAVVLAAMLLKHGFPQASMKLMYLATDLLAHLDAQAEQIRLLTMRADSAEWAVAEMRDELAAAEARAAEAEAQVAMLRVELAEQERELSYERQMRQQTEEAMIKLAGRVKEQTAELAEQEGRANCHCSARSDNECTCHA